MSFSKKVKNQLSKTAGEARHCRIAELSALLLCTGGVKILPNGGLEIRTDNIFAAQKFKRLLAEDFKTDCSIEIIKNSSFHRNNSFFLSVKDTSVVEKAVKSTGITISTGAVIKKVPALVIREECCVRAFLRGVFICSGSVSEPKKSHHFEVSVSDEKFCVELSGLFNRLLLDIKPKMTVRKGHFVIYFKDGEQICDILCAVGAFGSMLEYENSRIEKDVNNTINRRVNFENANLDKTINAAVKQINDIMIIKEKIGLTSLPGHLADIARARLENPEMSLVEIGLAANPPVGKSGVNHRLKKIGEIADSLI